MKSLRNEMHSMKQASEVVVDQTSTSVSKAGPSIQPDPITLPSNHLYVQPMETYFCGPSLPPRFSVQSGHDSQHSDPESDHSDPQSDHLERPTRVRSSKAEKNMQTKRNIKFGQNTLCSLHLQRKINPLSLLGSLLSLIRFLLSKTSNIDQTQYFTGR